jgi:hypothetical protein
VSLWHDPGVFEVGSGLEQAQWIELSPEWTGFERWFGVVQWEPLLVILVFFDSDASDAMTWLMCFLVRKL